MDRVKRQEIIEAIRQTAEANGGAPLGKARFEQATGIRESDWLGRHWARWSDAVTEAGLKPNVLQEGYDLTFLMRCLAEMIQELGKWPTVAERRMYRRDREGFPSHNTYQRLGNRREQAATLLDHADELDLPDDVVSVCSEIVGERRAPESESAPPTEHGYVYLLKSGRHYKIGHSNDPSRRLYEIRLQMPERVEEVHRIETDDPAGIEAYWHSRFKDSRKRGEWFELSRDQLRAFKDRKTM